MIEDPRELPEPDDGRTPLRNTPEWQLHRLNRIAAALWELRPQLGDDSRVAISVRPDDAAIQINLHVHAPADRVVAEQLVERLGWDVEADVRRVGMTKHHNWHGMVGGYRGHAVWIEATEVVDTQGRDQLPSDVGIGDPVADAEHVRLQGIARAGSGFEVLPAGLVDNQTGGVVEFTGHDGRRYVTTQQGEHQATPVPPMHADLIKLGYEL